MNLDELPQAVEDLRNGILSYEPLSEVLAEVLKNYDVTEDALRARFEQHFGLSVEEFAARNVRDNTVDGYVVRFRKDHSHYHPSRFKHINKRFWLESDAPDGTVIRKPYRFLATYGTGIFCISEQTRQISEIFDRDILNDVAAQIGWQRFGKPRSRQS